MHRHQAIVPFLFYDTTTKSRGLQLNITERRHFTTAAPFRVRAILVYSADHTCCCQSLQLLAASTATSFLSLVSYGVVRRVCLTMKFTAERVFLILFAWNCRLLLPLLYELDLSFRWVYFVLTNSPILTQPENNAASRWSLSLLTIRAAVGAFYWTQHDNSCSQSCKVYSDNKSTAEPDKLT